MAFYGMMKGHHGYMKGNAVREYNAIKAVCELLGLEVIEPRRQHWHGVENAAALMLEKMTDEQRAKVPGFVRRDSLLHPDVLAEARAEFSKPLKRAKK